jgi:zinc and cadmium transporter
MIINFNPIFFALLSTFIISLASLVGLISLAIKPEKLQPFIIYMVSFAVGALFGDAFIHLIPEAFSKTQNSLTVSLLILLGIVVFFSLEKFIRWRHCHEGDCGEHNRSLTVMNLVGDGLHNLIDGLLIGAGYLVSIPIGFTTTLAVLAHELPQEIGDLGVLIHSGYSVKKALVLNFISALIAVVGTGLSLVIGLRVQDYASYLLALTAGGFIYIAGADLIPELHTHTRPDKSVKQLLAILLGVAMMVGLLYFDK